MLKPIALFAVTLLLVSAGAAQEQFLLVSAGAAQEQFLLVSAGAAQEQKRSVCRFRFVVTERIGHNRWGAWPEDAIEWWAEEGNTKFPELCEATSQDADFVIAWLRTQRTETYSRPKRDDPWSDGRFPAGDCYTTPGQTTCSPGPDGSLSCYTSPPETVCTPRPAAFSEWEVHERQVERISATVFRITNGGCERVATVTKAGYDGIGRPGRAAFRSVMKAVQKKAGTARPRSSRACSPEEKRLQVQHAGQGFTSQ